MRLRAGVGILGALETPGGRVHVPMPLGFAGDAVGVGESGVEPLRGVRRRHLRQNHVHELVVEGLGVLGGIEVAMRFSPVAPTADQAVYDLFDRAFRTQHGLALGIQHGIALLIVLWHPGFAEVLLRQDVGGDLRPMGRHLDVVHLEDDGAIGVAQHRGAPLVGEVVVRACAGFGKASGDSHGRTAGLL
jgi:hypothetical protein